MGLLGWVHTTGGSKPQIGCDGVRVPYICKPSTCRLSWWVFLEKPAIVRLRHMDESASSLGITGQCADRIWGLSYHDMTLSSSPIDQSLRTKILTYASRMSLCWKHSASSQFKIASSPLL